MLIESRSSRVSDVERSQADFDTAVEIANRLADEAVWSGELCAFHGATAPEALAQPAVYRSFGGDLYEGSAGIARFLGWTARFTGDARLRRTACGALAHAFARTTGWSLFSGRTGVGLAALELARVLDRPDLVTPALHALELGSDEAVTVGAGGPFDLLGGSAGVIHALIASLEYDLDGGWRERSRLLGRQVMAGARRTERGWSWPMLPSSTDHLCGFGHGAAGIAFALTELAALLPDQPDWLEAAGQARSYERAWFSPSHGSWADLRSDTRGPEASYSYPHFWCHGSVGIGHDRIAVAATGLATTLDRADAVAAVAGARAAAERILAGPAGPGAAFDVNGSQCHGIAGFVDLLVEAWRFDGDPALLRLCRSLTAFMRNDAGPGRHWRCGIPAGGPAPGLMVGVAGIGWAHLRAWNPREIPCAWSPQPSAAPA
jgi:lantibiotic modifying enzyme